MAAGETEDVLEFTEPTTKTEKMEGEAGITDSMVDPAITLATYLRSKLMLRGTKIACAEGGCGACTVMLSWKDEDGGICHVAVNACLTPVCCVNGMSVTTVEGIGSTTTKLHPVQERIAKAHGSQCGFCTPGFVMSMYTLLRNNPVPSMEEIHHALEGNLCRCTGYRPILEGFRTFTKGCCGERDKHGCCRNSFVEEETVISTPLFRTHDWIPYDPTQDVIFPPDLLIKGNKTQGKDCVVFRSDRVKWFQPLTMDRLLHLKRTYPKAKMIMGNTEIGIEVKFKDQYYPVFINAKHIHQLNGMEVSDTGVHIGAAVTLSRLSVFLTKQIKEQEGYKTKILKAITEMLGWFAGIQIRNVATIGGNIVTASPISDLNPLLMAAQATLDIASVDGTRTVKLDDSFFKGYRQIDLDFKEVLTSIYIPFTQKNEHFYGFKQAQRKEDDIAIVNAGMFVKFREENNIVDDVRLAFGGMAATTVLAMNTMKDLIGSIWDQNTMDRSMKTLLEDLALPPGAPGGMEQYRTSLVLGFFLKFFMKVNNDINADVQPFPSSWSSAMNDLTIKPFKSTQIYQVVSDAQNPNDPIGRPEMAMAALQQSTGEAAYVDDLPALEGELFLSLVFSSKPHADIKSLNLDDAFSVNGVFDIVVASDVPGENKFGTIVVDEELFADRKVECVGQVIAGVLAKDVNIAQRAARLVKVEYEEREAILTVEDAINKSSFLTKPVYYAVGDTETALRESDHMLEGEMKIGGQEHFYMETQCCIAIPKGEFGEMEVISSTQDVAHIQFAVASALGIPSNRVVARCKRMGGAFGGKESKSCFYAALAAVAANKSKRPVRLVLDRSEDMLSSGTRHPFLAKYKIGFTKEGKIEAAEVHYYANGGHSFDFTPAVVNVACKNADNAYKLPNFKLTGHCCKTNIPSTTAFRGFGAPQGMIVTETWMTEVANYCGLSQTKIREINFYSEGDLTHCHQLLTGCNIQRCWETCLNQCDFQRRKLNVDQFNRENRWKKKGIAIIPAKLGVSFSGAAEIFLNQAGALVHVYKDGAVLLTHGGTEMGQGLYTKMLQVASRALGIPIGKIHTNECATDKVPNTSPTAASSGSDLNGMAVKEACEKIMTRLQPIIENKPTASWEVWVHDAYFQRISLSATGYYATPDLFFDAETKKGRCFNYYCYGAAASEVQIDCLTGDHVVVRTDIVMDVGNSLNPAIDIGQIEGAFSQGYGLFLLEDYRISPKGDLLTKGPGAYKLPSIGNTPAEFNVTLLDNSNNPTSIYSSKAVGEPPLFLSASVLFAVRDAITSARVDANLSSVFRLDTPAVPERIRMACQDQFMQKIKPMPLPDNFKPFFIRP